MPPNPRRFPSQLLLTLDLIGTFVFAVEGALAAINARLDLFGLLVLSFVTALGGGIIRDVLIGAVPPASIRDWRYGMTAILGGFTVFFFYALVRQAPPALILTLDAAGLALFAMAGCEKALDFGIPRFTAVMMGGITGVGGGTLRDLLSGQVPAVLKADVYATAALAGATVLVLGLRAGWNRTLMLILGGTVCFALRMISVYLHWNLPVLQP